METELQTAVSREMLLASREGGTDDFKRSTKHPPTGPAFYSHDDHGRAPAGARTPSGGMAAIAIAAPAAFD